MAKKNHEVLISTEGTLNFRKQGELIVGFKKRKGLSGKPLDLSQDITAAANQIILSQDLPESEEKSTTN